MSRRAVVTGLGLVTPLGNDVATNWSALLAGRSGIAPISLFDPTGYRSQIAGEVKDLDPLRYMEAREGRHMDRSVQFAVAASREAIGDAGLDFDQLDRDKVGVIYGSAVGGVSILIAQNKTLEERGPSRVSPFMASGLPNAASVQLAMAFEVKGPNMTVVSACASGNHAIGEAMETIRRGAADVMLTGGADALILPVMVAGLSSMRVLSADNEHPQEASKPFDLHRDGFVLGEGAATLVLEADEHARARGARIYAEVAGYGTGNDAYHISKPSEDGEGTARVMDMALREAGMRPKEIDYINAHGTSTVINDKYETKAIKRVFGEYAYRVPISSIKSMIGHTMGAAGAIEAVVTVLAMQHGIIPPTINLRTPDPDCDLDYVPWHPRPAEIKAALSNSIGLGGHNAALVFRHVVV